MMVSLIREYFNVFLKKNKVITVTCIRVNIIIIIITVTMIIIIIIVIIIDLIFINLSDIVVGVVVYGIYFI